MESPISVNWWVLALRGVAGVLLAIAAFAYTGMTLAVLIALLALYLFIDGILAIVAGARGRSWLMFTEGLFGLIAGFVTVLLPGLTALALALVIAAWAILTGIAELAVAIWLRRLIANEWTLAFGGVASIVLGVLMVIFPRAGLLAIVWIIGAYALVWGILLLGLAFRLRSHRGRLIVAP